MHAGTQNLGAPLRVRVTAVAGNTVLAGIVALLERAQAERPRLAQAADRAAAWFLSRILIGSAIVFAVWWFVDPSQAFPATLAVLVVTCPCALSLATPAVLAAATADLARRGVLVAHSDAFEALAKATHVLWDKTGTLTHGLVRVEEVRPLRDMQRSDASRSRLRSNACRNTRSPRLSLASGAATATATDVVVTAGAGLEGTVDGRRLRIGTLEFARGPRARSAGARRQRGRAGRKLGVPRRRGRPARGLPPDGSAARGGGRVRAATRRARTAPPRSSAATRRRPSRASRRAAASSGSKRG